MDESSPIDYLEVALDRAGTGDEVKHVKTYRNVNEPTVYEAVIANPEDPDFGNPGMGEVRRCVAYANSVKRSLRIRFAAGFSWP